MTATQTSQCHCGAVNLTFPKQADFTFSCHCESCQQLVSGGRLFGFVVPKESLTVTGETSQYEYKGGSGGAIKLNFCPHCSTQLFANPDALDGKLVVRSNMLESPNAFAPDNVLFTETACACDHAMIQ